MDILISGGCKNGKSYYAQEVARDIARMNKAPLYYLATMEAVDEEDRARILRHRDERRGWGFETIEQPRDLEDCLDRIDPFGVVLLDSVTALLSNEMFSPYVDGEAWTADLNAASRVERSLARFASSVAHTIFVSDYIYGESCRYGDLTEEYRRGLALIDRSLARKCDKVIEVTFGLQREYT